ncbi:hypothetical protein ENH_00001710 [Eimeria necatrix]|uniref:Uncharacterized protein n=1 Tax=Eimeria necatrix TaxID=51315 RepID=U6MRT2_9EIME|nr:hypothetical protein ENH_00001710 [Eimeria necatrix]CDJ65164.1 hypothetical protein ENH_00001710 [Eimeria necatrix]
MVGRGHARFDVKAATELVPKIRLETGVAVRYEHLWKSVIAEKTVCEKLHDVMKTGTARQGINNLIARSLNISDVQIRELRKKD